MMNYKPFVDKKNIRTALNSFLDGYCGKSLEDHILFKLFVIQNQLCHIAYLSSNPDRDLKGKLYTRYLAKESVKWLRRNLGE